jgi:hypothetical protein
LIAGGTCASISINTQRDTPRRVSGCRYPGRMPALDHLDRVQRFVLRARKVMEHSLVREHLPVLNKLATGTFDLHVEVNRKTGEGSHRLRLELPPEEAFESFAVRLRPFTSRKETVYWASVLNSLEKLLSKETLAEFVDIQSLGDYWIKMVEGSGTAQAYYVMTESGHVTDFKLANEWLNSDALHTQLFSTAVGEAMGLNERYYAAACVFSRIGMCMEYTLCFIAYLRHAGLLQLDEWAFNEPVLADGCIDRPTRALCAPVGSTPMPSDISELDLSKWKPVHEDPQIMALIERRRDAEPEADTEAEAG